MIIFRQERVEKDKVIEKLQAKTWSWIVVKETRCRKFSFKDLCHNPKVVIGELAR